MTQNIAMLPTPPHIDISSPGAAAKSLRAFDRWHKAQNSRHGEVRLAIDCMRMKAAHRSEAMMQKSREVIDASPSPERWRERSRFFPGIATAMAQQWGSLLLAETETEFA